MLHCSPITCRTRVPKGQCATPAGRARGGRGKPHPNSVSPSYGYHLDPHRVWGRSPYPFVSCRAGEQHPTVALRPTGGRATACCCVRPTARDNTADAAKQKLWVTPYLSVYSPWLGMHNCTHRRATATMALRTKRSPHAVHSHARPCRPLNASKRRNT